MTTMTNVVDGADCAIPDLLSVDRVMAVLAEVSHESWNVQVAGGTVEVSLTERRMCGGCGQLVTVSGHVDWLTDDGSVQGGWAHQHGCGTWNSPYSATRRDVPDHVDDGALVVLVEAMVADVLSARNEALERERSEIRARLLLALEEAMHADEETGSEVSPGCYRTGDGCWVAWDWDPDLGDGTSSWGTVTVTDAALSASGRQPR